MSGHDAYPFEFQCQRSGNCCARPDGIVRVARNLAAPSSTWIRLETAIIFTNGAVENPDVAATEIEQDLLAYVRTLTLDQLQGASALGHLRDDLNERVAIRTEGAVSEIVVKTMVMQ